MIGVGIGIGIIARPSSVRSLMSLLAAIGGRWWSAADATLDGGIASGIAEKISGNDMTFGVASSHTRPGIGALGATTDATLVLNGTQSGTLDENIGTQTSHTFLCVFEYQTQTSEIAAFVWGGGASTSPTIVPCYRQGVPQLFAGGSWVAAGTGTPAVGTVELIEFSLDDATNAAKIYRNGAQIGESGAYGTSTQVGVFSSFGCIDTIGAGSLKGEVSDLIYIPRAINQSERDTIRSLLKRIHVSLP